MAFFIMVKNMKEVHYFRKDCRSKLTDLNSKNKQQKLLQVKSLYGDVNFFFYLFWSEMKQLPNAFSMEIKNMEN